MNANVTRALTHVRSCTASRPCPLGVGCYPFVPLSPCPFVPSSVAFPPIPARKHRILPKSPPRLPSTLNPAKNVQSIMLTKTATTQRSAWECARRRIDTATPYLNVQTRKGGTIAVGLRRRTPFKNLTDATHKNEAHETLGTPCGPLAPISGPGPVNARTPADRTARIQSPEPTGAKP